MDIQKIISDLVGKLAGNGDLISKFSSNPLETIKELLGIDLDPGLLTEVVNGVTSKLGGEAVKEGKGFIDKIKGLFGKADFSPGDVLRGNFYKCGDDAAFPHYGMWSPVLTGEPDFHRPEYFGELALV